MQPCVLAPAASEVRKLGEGHVHAERSRPGLDCQERRTDSGVHVVLRNEITEEKLRADVGRDGADADYLAAFQDDAGRTPAFDQNAFDGGIGADNGTVRGGGRGHRFRDCAHAAFCVSPMSRLAVHLAEAVVQQDISRSGRRRGGVGADDAVEGE